MQALAFTNKAIEHLNDLLPVKYCIHLLKDILKRYKKVNFRIIIKVLRLSARAFAVNRDFYQARLVIQHALSLSNDYFESDPYIVADVYMDYAYYLSQIHYCLSSMEVYRIVLDIYEKMYKEPNMYHIIAERDLALTMLKLTPAQAKLKNCTRYYYPIAR